MIRHLFRQDLDKKNAETYCKDILSDGNALSKLIYNLLPFNTGIFYTLLPENADLSRLHFFEHGGILPKFPEEEIYIKGFDKPFIGERVNSINPELAIFFNRQLMRGNGRSIIFEEVVKSPGDPHTDFLKSHGLLYKEEIYYLLSQKDNKLEIISRAINESYDFSHFVCVITQTSFEDIEDKKFTLKKMKEVCENIEFLIIGAYDGEGYIFWERAEKNPKSSSS
jgi:hypothetical protein